MQIREMPAHRGNYGGIRTEKVEYIVIHYTGNDGDSGASNGRYFQKRLERVASAHFFVDDWGVIRSVPVERVAYHCGAASYRHPKCRNGNSIGVELCDCCRDGRVMATEQTLANAAELVAELMTQYRVPPERVLRHYDVTGKRCPAYWVDAPEGFSAFRRRCWEAMELVEQSKVIVDGKEIPVRRILKEGVNYVKLRDLAGALGLVVGFQGSIATIDHPKTEEDGNV